MNILDLFSGIGGISLGLEMADPRFKTVAFCEQDKYAQKILMKHWPKVPVFKDVCLVNERSLLHHGPIDMVVGGFPCQDISVAGKGAGLEGKRSGLWYEMLRIIEEMGPRWVLIENVSALRGRGLSVILQNLSEIGYDAEWHCIPASYVGAPHERDRIWIVAYPEGQCGDVSIFDTEDGSTQASQSGGGGGTGDVPNTTSKGLQGRTKPEATWTAHSILASSYRHGRQDVWLPEPNVDRVVDGIPNRVHRMKALGNSVVPQVVKLIGEGIAQHENSCM